MDLQALYNQALELHQRGNLEEAERLYLRLVQAAPGNFAPRYYLGVIRAQQGRNEDALALIAAAVAARPDVPEMLLNHGNVLTVLGRHAEALASYDKALANQPEYVEALVGRAGALNAFRRYAEALDSVSHAFALAPPSALMLKIRGVALWELCRFDEALADFDAALVRDPGALELMNYRGHVLCESGRVAEGFAQFRQSAARAVGAGKGAPPGAPPHRLRHDAEQQAWLGDAVRVDGPLRLDGGDALDTPAINPVHAEAVSRQWQQSSPKLVVMDDLLTPQALAGLQRFCLGSNIWRQVSGGGYLGALPEHGFACPLLAQIAEEFRATYPAIFAVHPLRYIWAFKYDSRLDGIKIHADEAAVNVNFWITPDAANLDPARGGLVVWDKAAPLDWDFNAFNGDDVAPRAFLQRSGAKAVSIPYRANRAVVFDSNLFHETDRISFRDGYENRRINITLLYGRRETA